MGTRRKSCRMVRQTSCVILNLLMLLHSLLLLLTSSFSLRTVWVSLVLKCTFSCLSFSEFSLEVENKGNHVDQRFSCHKCCKQYTLESSLKRHMQTHTGQYRYHCEICRKGFNVNTHYNLHMRSHEGIKYYCQYCGKSFVNKQSHDYHLSVHTGRYRFRCDKCKEGFNYKRNYSLHVEKCY